MTQTLPTRRREWAALLALMLGFSVVFAVYYPPLSGIEDELGYINQAVVWSRGAVSEEGAGLSGLVDFWPVGGRHVSTRHPGRSLAALPFLMIGGGKALYASGLLLHLAMTLIAAGLLARLGRSPLWAVLLLFHPTLAIYSRTIMADAAAGTGLLLAALALTYPGGLAAVGAGMAVGLGAVMRHHAAMALPLVAASCLYPPGRARPWRDAALCCAGGAAVGGLIVAYNFILYGAPVVPLVSRYGYFSIKFLIPHAIFYATALLTIWPAMLLAPLFDRSSLRWLTRGVIAIFLGPLLFYYFHDRTANRLETMIVGQRLLQIALPLWIVSYAGVLDDWLAAPIRRRFGERVWSGLVALTCLGLLVANASGFARHQRHLNALREARDAIVTRVPEGSLIYYPNSVYKLIGVAVGVPSYRLRPYETLDPPLEFPEALARDLERAPRPWYLASLAKTPGEPLDPTTRWLIDRLALDRLPVGSPLVSLYVCRPLPGRAAAP